MDLGDLGRQDEALAASEEAVAIRRQLADANPAVYLPDLANSLNNLADALAMVGRDNEANEARTEAQEAAQGFRFVHAIGNRPDV